MEFQLHVHGRIDSTSERAFAALADGIARHGDAHVASEQTAGRGRRGATWHSAPGEGLYASVILLPPPPALHPAALTMAAGLAVQRAALHLGVPTARLKWPNDVVVAGAKLAGILVETRGLDPMRPHYVVGIGVNVAQRAFPPDLERARPVTSLALQGVRASVDEVREAVLAELARTLELVREPADALTSAFLDATGLRDQPIAVEMPDRRFEGTWEGLTLARGLQLIQLDGTRRALPLEHIRQVSASFPG